MSSPSSFLLLLLLLAAATGLSGAAQAAVRREPLVGGYQKIKDVNDPHIKEIGLYAVTEHNRLSGQSLVFVGVVSGRQQVVAGMNYDLVIKARDGRRAPALYEAVVYERAWENYRNLTSFNPKP
ncbi:hypothetical protein Taro_031137 [Colocasia esculenta]|uniref:Cystatin domain-containing protein n=1 Tax=Colocasia esculenta TaxID=4460 RepID=A0A843W5H3_COLES|nr:hypothetical protein [Colocasia esculenta]